MKSRFGRWLLGLLVLSPSLVFAEALDLKRVPAGAVWLVHLDVDRLKAADIGAFLLEQAQDPDAARQLAAAQAVFNFDPRKDLKSLTVCGSDATEKGFVLMADGAFDAARLATIAGGEAEYAKTAHGEDTIHQWLDRQQGQTLFAAFPSDGRMIVGRGAEAVKGALDTLRGRAPAMNTRDGAALARPANNLPLLTAGVSFERMPPGAELPPFLQGAKTARLNISELAGQVSLELALDFDQAERAAQVRDMALGLVAVAALNAQENPELAELAQRLNVSSEGGSVRAIFRMPAAQLREAAMKAREKAVSIDPPPAPGTPPPAEF